VGLTVEKPTIREDTAIDPLETVRMIATVRILMRRSKLGLSSGRLSLTREAHLVGFLAGANSICYGAKPLTTGNSDVEVDQALLHDAGLRPAPVGE
jgi:biotin synthase